MNPLQVQHQNIWQYKQNKLRYIARDFKELFNISEEYTYKILLARGVFKWLAIRRDLIKLKDIWKVNIKFLNERIPNLKNISKENIHPANYYNYGYAKGYKKALEDCRKQIRLLCHSERWQAPDYDKEALKFLENYK